MLDEMLASLNIIKILSDLDRFEKWLEKTHDKGVDKKLLDGLKFVLIGAIRLFLYAIELDRALGLKEDYVFFRARFEGITIENVPNTSEKTIFIKNVRKLSRKIRKARHLMN